MTTTAAVLLHPVRLRVVQALLGDRRLTAAALHAELDDVPLASLYRHLAVLVDAGVLTVVAERRVRAVVERTYALDQAAASVDRAELQRLTPDEHLRGFNVFVAGLLRDFGRYLAGDSIDLVRDRVGYRTAALWLSDEETDRMVHDLVAVLTPYLDHRPAAGRRRRLFSTVLLPADPPPGHHPGVSL